MRFLHYIVICTFGLACFTPAYANKTQLPNEITLKLNHPVASGKPLVITTSLGVRTDFYQGAASLTISPMGQDASTPIEVFGGNGKAGFDFSSEVRLPSLSPGKYRVNGTFLIYRDKKDTSPIRAGTNLYLEIRANQVLSSNISFSHIKRQELKARLDAEQQRHPSTDISTLKTQNPELSRSLDAVNEVQATQSIGVQTLKANSPSAAMQQRPKPVLVQTIELSAGQIETADPRKRPVRKVSRLDKQNAVLETQDNDY
jgi:hypothetical protein